MGSQTLSLLFLAALSPAVMAGGTVLRVDDGGGGGAFTTIQGAIDVAGDGDVILVEDGAYSGFDITGLSVSVLGLGSDVEVDGIALVRDLTSSQRVVLRNLGTPKDPDQNLGFGVRCGGNAGIVWVENCRIDAFNEINVSLAVWNENEYAPENATFVAGVLIENSQAAIYGTSMTPGKVTGFFGHRGAITVEDATVLISGTTVLGAAGFDCLELSPCGFPTDGGNALELRSGGLARIQDSVTVGGLGGAAVPTSCSLGCGPAAADGEGIELNGGVPLSLAGPALAFSAQSPVAAGTSATFEIQATPTTALAAGFFGASPFFLDFDVFAGTLVVAPPFTTLSFGAVDGTGAISANVSLGTLPPSVESVQVFGQLVVIDPGLGTRLGAASSLEIVRADLL